MPLDRVKLLKLRENINAYIRKMEEQDPATVVGKITGAKIDELARAIQTLPVAEDRTDEVVDAIRGIKMPVIKDNTGEIVKAISTIRFPQVFPDHISVDNFPPQKIPQPVTNVKATLVGDETGLLGGGGDIIHEFGQQNIAAGNTMVMATYTVPAGKILNVSGVYGEGIDDGIFMLYIDGIKVWQARNAWTDRNVQGYLLYDASAGQVVEFKIKNNKAATRAYTGGFYGRQIDA